MKLLLGLTMPVLLLFPWVGVWILRCCHHLKTNYRGEPIPQSFGVVLLSQLGALWGIGAVVWPMERPRFLQWGLLSVGYGLLGLWDDVMGSSQHKGFRGHLKAFFWQKKITTGMGKVLGGGLLALSMGWWLYAPNPFRALLTALLIALGANTVNLFDLRPGRAIGVSLLAGAPLLFLETSPRTHSPLFWLLLCLISLWPYDAFAKAMLGDAGSNLLGACLGLACAQNLTWPVQLMLVLLMALLQGLAERVSLSEIIESHSFLRALDRLTGQR